jgi:uncharacterized membrane protein
MIQVHFTELLSAYYDSSSLLFNISDLVGSLPAPLFTFLVGMSLFVSIKRQESLGFPPEAISDRNLRRGMALFFLGLLFAALIWAPAEVFGWDILTLIGASLLIVFPLRKLKNGILTAIIFLAVLVWPIFFAANYTGRPDHWFYYGDVVPTAYALALSLLFILLFYGLIVLWDKCEGRYSLEWLLRRLTG